MSKLVNLTGLTRFWTKAKDYIDTALNGKVDKVSGKGLSTNDLTATLKGNYDAAYTHSNNNAVHVTAAQKTAWDAKADGDHNHNGTYALASHSHAYSDLTGRPTIPTKVSQLTDAADYVKKTDITGVYKYKGSVANVARYPPQTLRRATCIMSRRTAATTHGLGRRGMRWAALLPSRRRRMQKLMPSSPDRRDEA